jgi:hypothetical protein
VGKEPPIYGFARMAIPVLVIMVLVYLIRGCLGC